MPFATAPDGVRIHYEIEGDGPPLVLQHGLLRDLNNWRERGYIERLAPRYQCVLVDSRGHGESDKPDDLEAYELRTRVVDLASVLHDANIETAHYLGYSMGGWIGYGISIYMPQRFRSLALGGFNPLRPNPRAGQSSDLSDPAMKHCRDALLTWGGARQALRLVNLPVLLFAGTADPNGSADDMPIAAADAKDASFFAVNGADHSGAADAVDIVAPRVIEFIDRVEANR